jgi:hypothetical protein
VRNWSNPVRGPDRAGTLRSMLDGSAADHALRELDALRAAIDEGRYAEASLRIELLERDLAGRDAAVVGIWQRLLTVERERIERRTGTSQTA